MTKKLRTLVSWYDIEIQTFSLNKGFGMPPAQVSKPIATVIAFFARIVLFFGVQDPRTKERDEKKEARKYRKLSLYSWKLQKKVIQDYEEIQKQFKETGNNLESPNPRILIIRKNR